jgi:hypothetical protein
MEHEAAAGKFQHAIQCCSVLWFYVLYRCNRRGQHV